MLERTPVPPLGPPLTVKVMTALRERIAARGLRPGARLPSIRTFAEEQGVSKSTVVEAYERLAAEGVIASRRGSGFYVAGGTTPLMLAAAGPRTDRAIDPLWIMRQSLETGEAAIKPGCGWLPERWLPSEAIRKGLRTIARAQDTSLVEYASPLGFAPLRSQLSRRLAEAGVEAAPRQIMLTDSATQAIDLVCRLFLRPGDRILVDDPCYFNFLGLARAHRAEVLGVPMTPTGPDLDVFARLAAEQQPRLYLTTAVLHNPTGVSVTPAVLHRLLNIATTNNMLVVEDDIFADFDPDPLSPRLAALDGFERVIQVGSFSKTLSAAVRCGYVAASPDRIEALADLKLATAFGNGDLSARLVHALLTNGSYRRHVEGLRTKLARAMSDTSLTLQDLGLRIWAEPRAGLFLWTELPEGLDAAAIAREAMAEDVVLAPGNVFSIRKAADRFMRFNVAQSGDPRVAPVLRRLLQAKV